MASQRSHRSQERVGLLPHTCFRGDTGTPPNCRGRMARAPCGPSMRKAPLLPSEHVSVLPSWERRPRPRRHAGWRLPRTAASWKFPPHPAPQSKPPTRAVAIFKMSVLTPSWGPHPKTEIRARNNSGSVSGGPWESLWDLLTFCSNSHVSLTSEQRGHDLPQVVPPAGGDRRAENQQHSAWTTKRGQRPAWNQESAQGPD